MQNEADDGRIGIRSPRPLYALSCLPLGQRSKQKGNRSERSLLSNAPSHRGGHAAAAADFRQT